MTVNSTTHANDRPDYLFEVTATDNHGAQSLTSSTEFHVKVLNDPTNVGASLNPLNPDGPAVSFTNQTLTEDGSALNLTAVSADNQETNNSSYFHDAYFELTVVDPSGTSHTLAGSDYNANQQWYSYTPNAANGGGTIWLNKDTGQIEWTDGALNSTVGPNDADVGA